MMLVVDKEFGEEKKRELVVEVEECKIPALLRKPKLDDLAANLPKLIRSTQLSAKFDRFELASQLLCVEMVNHVVDEPTLIGSQPSPFMAYQSKCIESLAKIGQL